MTNPFSHLINSEFKQLYKDAIDSLLETTALTVPCVFKYSGAGNTVYCNNCIFDTISGLSSNKYNNRGPNPFPEGSICPSCMGMGMTTSASSSETIYLACIFDSKYWINWSSKMVNIPDGMVQTISKVELLPKIRNASEIIMDANISKYGNYTYERAGDPEPAGLGSNSYIITMWKRK
jgi:hypothetical protein